ncbi:hypothetical protein [Streptomyces sp. NPDC006739]|uniref:hypothetical protein n=1 Tax=Streptomyces sp. NPDC006739 TaxID=3364763 RepID=UPI00369257C0
MSPWPRFTLRLVRLLIVLAAVGPPYGTAHAATAAPSPSASASAVAAEPSRAGSRAGEGRLRPGRREGPAAQIEGDDDTGEAPTTPDAVSSAGDETVDGGQGNPTDSASPQDAGLAPATPRQRPANTGHSGEAADDGPTLRILPLGSGLVLIGLGLALAFVGLRVRRG